MAPRVVCFGELLWDRFPDAERLGGAPANAAYHLAALGNRVALISRVGRDARGDRALAELAAHNVDVSCVQRDDLPTGVVEVDLSGAEPRYEIRAPAAWDRIALDDACRALLDEADGFVYGTLSGRDNACLDDALAALPGGCLKLCDVNLRRPFDDSRRARACIRAADVVKLNSEEATVLGVPASRIVAITRGAQGADIIHAGATDHAPGIPSGGGDPVGAGDAYTAALMHQLLRGVEPAEANARANAYAAYVASQPGAMPQIPPAVASLSR